MIISYMLCYNVGWLCLSRGFWRLYILNCNVVEGERVLPNLYLRRDGSLC